jgi:hypothetical protein
MTFYLHVNHVHRYARIHRGDCAFCNHGRGIHDRGSGAVATRWSFPLPTVADAAAEASRVGFAVSACTRCDPTGTTAG